MDAPAAPRTRPNAGLDAGWAETTARLRAFIARRVDNPDIAEDITQDVLTRSLAGGTLDTVDNPTGWLYQVARNAVIDHYRLRRRHQPLLDADDNWTEAESGDRVPNQATRELARCLQPLIEQLPTIYRDALTRVDLHGETDRQAAAAAGLSVSGMKSRVQRGRHQLRDLLTACCRVHTDGTGAILSYHPDRRRCASNCDCLARDDDSNGPMTQTQKSIPAPQPSTVQRRARQEAPRDNARADPT
jgi:RNA polymerase sigma-70 factor (ECF subfamily)